MSANEAANTQGEPEASPDAFPVSTHDLRAFAC
jgi:hypothetical protein